MDQFIDDLLTKTRVCDQQLPRLQDRITLELNEELMPRVSVIEEDGMLEDLEEGIRNGHAELDQSPAQNGIDQNSQSDEVPLEIDKQIDKGEGEAESSQAKGAALPPKTIGICATSGKARSKAMSSILRRLQALGNYQTVYMDECLDQAIEDWPVPDYLIAFFSEGFDLPKAIAYSNLRDPICINDLTMQKLLLDRRLVLAVLDMCEIPTPRRMVVQRGAPLRLDDDTRMKFERHMKMPWTYIKEYRNVQMIDQDTIEVDGIRMEKPFLEKPVDGERHDIWLYHHSRDGGGIRKLFRKVKDKSSEFVPNRWQIREDGSYIFEQFLNVDNAEDVKVYTVGPYRFHAETRKSPVVDGVVLRNSEGKELRYQSELNENEQEMARRLCTAFDQMVCGFDILRYKGESYVIDVNGWSFVKGNESYFDLCANALHHIFLSMQKRRKPIYRMLESEFGKMPISS